MIDSKTFENHNHNRARSTYNYVMERAHSNQ